MEDEPRGKPQQVGCMRASASASLSRKGLSGKARTKTGIGKSDLPGLQGGPRKCDFVFLTRCTRLGSIPTRRFRRVQVALPAGSQVEDMKFGLSVLTMKETHDG